MEKGRPTQEAPRRNVANLTQENMLHHEAMYCNTAVCSGNAGHPVAEIGVFRIGGELTPPTKTKPKTCGMALAMVAIFCYFPGISMMVSVVTVGFTNRSIVGIVFTTIAVTLSITSAVLCLCGRVKCRKSKYKAMSSIVPTTSVVAKSRNPTISGGQSTPLLTSRDELITENDSSGVQDPLVMGAPTDTGDPILAKKIADSFSLRRYFADIATVSGPFDLSHEEMDRLTAIAIRGPQNTTQQHNVTSALKQEEYSSSVDSAIDIDSDIPSLEAALFV